MDPEGEKEELGLDQCKYILAMTQKGSQPMTQKWFWKRLNSSQESSPPHDR